MDAKAQIASALAPLTGMTPEELSAWIETPKDAKMGDAAFPCFRLAKTLRKAPNIIAAELNAKLGDIDSIEKREAVGGYLNFYFAKGDLTDAVLASVLASDKGCGASDEGNGKTVCCEYSSINIAKPVHIGHLYTTVLGSSLARIYKHLGYNVVSINHLGDWGTQFGKMIVAYKKWGDKDIVEREGVRGLVRLYVKFHEEAEKDPTLEDEARAWFRRIELGDEESVALWKWFKQVSLDDVMKTYELLGVHFDSFAGESFYEDMMQPVIDELGEKGLLTVDKGATLVDLSAYDMPPCIILKKDGATLYATRDLAAARYRKRTYDFYKSLYVVAYQQNLHFRQFFKVLELMGDEWVKDCVHVNFGMVSIEEGTLSTRHGNIVYLEDVLKASIEKTRKVMDEKSPDLTPDERETAARQVGVGAVVWMMLYNSRIKDVQFSWTKSLSFEGETGPYAQYTHARCCSVLKKAGSYDKTAVDASMLSDASAQALVKAIAAFPAAVKAAAEKYEPYLVARATMDICASYNKFYFDNRIMDDDPAVRNARLAITDAAREVIKTGLYLIGLEAPERM